MNAHLLRVQVLYIMAFKYVFIKIAFNSGFPSNGDKSEWTEARNISRNKFERQRQKYNEWVKGLGLPTTDSFFPEISLSNLYGYPEELDYTDIRPLPDNWFAVDSFMRKKEEELRLPKEFEEKLNKNEGKLFICLWVQWVLLTSS